MIIVCAAGLQGSNADDVAKEVAIYRAHKASPIVIASEGEERFSAALHVLTVPVGRPRPGLRPGHGGRPPVRLRGRARHRRHRPPAAPGPGRHRAPHQRARRPSTATSCWPPCAPTSRRWRRGSPTGCAAASYDGTPRGGAPRSAWPRSCATPSGLAPLEHYEVEHGRAGSPARPRRGPHRRPHRRHRGAHPARRRHQAPGQDRHRGHLPQRRGPAPGPAGRGHPRRRGASRPGQLPGPAHPRRPRPRGRRGPRLHPLRRRGRRREPPGHRAGRRPGRHLPRPARCAPSATRSCGAPSTGWRPSARSRWRWAAATGAPS